MKCYNMEVFKCCSKLQMHGPIFQNKSLCFAGKIITPELITFQSDRSNRSGDINEAVLSTEVVSYLMLEGVGYHLEGSKLCS